MPQMHRVPIAYFHIVTPSGQDLGWVGFCEELDEAMVPMLLHRGGEDGARERAKTDPPKPLGFHGGAPFAPFSWMLGGLRDESYVPVLKAMDYAARSAFAESNRTTNAETAPATKECGI
uniref:hypothetical protein n=1 Tax=Cupriavidus gilardii TaxID=82541 RepID=UPI00247896CD|nr:hypothetical protein [Cupriavidus gilardii]